MSQIGKNIKKIRNIKGLSQQAFADLFELTRGNISSYEENRAEPKIEVIARIANYFSIPLSDFIEKELSVNELLHYNTALVLDANKLKSSWQLVQVPYVPELYVNEYIQQYADESFIARLPVLLLPDNSKFKLLAIEIYDQEILPGGFNYRKGDILIFENVNIENVHRIINKLGMQVNMEGIKFGTYNNEMQLSLNEWVHYPFNLDSETHYWSLRAVYAHM